MTCSAVAGVGGDESLPYKCRAASPLAAADLQAVIFRAGVGVDARIDPRADASIRPYR